MRTCRVSRRSWIAVTVACLHEADHGRYWLRRTNCFWTTRLSQLYHNYDRDRRALAVWARSEWAVALTQPPLRGGGEVVMSGGVAQIKPVRIIESKKSYWTKKGRVKLVQWLLYWCIFVVRPTFRKGCRFPLVLVMWNARQNMRLR